MTFDAVCDAEAPLDSSALATLDLFVDCSLTPLLPLLEEVKEAVPGSDLMVVRPVKLELVELFEDSEFSEIFALNSLSSWAEILSARSSWVVRFKDSSAFSQCRKIS